MKEIWKDIQGYDGIYQVSNLGRVKSLDRYIKRAKKRYFKKGILLKQSLDKNTGYLYVNLYTQSKLKRCTVHRLVAQTFIPNPNNLPQVNHKDENKTNNNVDNLEWCTNKYNCTYGTHNTRNSLWHHTHYTGKNNPFYGKHHTKDTRKNISIHSKGKIRITNGINNKTIYPNEFEYFQKLGWRKGMTKRHENDTTH